jgi:hypothetical protein
MIRYGPLFSGVCMIVNASWFTGTTARADGEIDTSIQAALDANPGRMVHVPPGEHHIDRPLVIRADHTGLYGYGTIVQTNPAAGIIEIERAVGVRIELLTLTRPAGKTETGRDGIRVEGGEHIRLTGVRILNNQSTSAAIRVTGSRHVRIAGCEITNYKRIGVDDRTTSELYGYAFRAVLGDGMIVKTSTDVLILNNTIVERAVASTEEAKKQHGLGRLVEGRQPTRKGRFAPPGDYAPHWHQGSAVVVTSPELTRHVLIRGNLIENAAQGVDIHADHVTLTGNVIHHAFVGIKCMHGSRNVIITDNNVSNVDLWGLVMLPGTASHDGSTAEENRPAAEPNVTRGNLIANNIFSNFGYGHDYHNWMGSDSRNVLQFESGPLETNPPMRDVVVQGNVVYNTDTSAAGDARYNHAVYLDPKLDARTFRFSGNLFHPGKRGVANVELPR